MPTCVRIEATYAFGVNATIVVEGVNVRFYIDGERESLKCIAPALQSETESSSSVNMVQNYYGNFGGTSFLLFSHFHFYMKTGENDNNVTHFIPT
jgi:hypothetical protein